jgi:hypothetical protein
MKRLAFFTLAAFALAGCTWLGGSSDSESAGSTAEPAGPVAIYGAVVHVLVGRDHTFGDRDPGFRAVYILDGAVPGVRKPPALAGSPRRPFAAELKEGLIALLADLPPVRFVRTRDEALSERNPGVVKNRGALVTLGPIRREGRRAEVAASLWVAPKGAIWLTYIVRRRGDAWKVTGTRLVAIA